MTEFVKHQPKHLVYFNIPMDDDHGYYSKPEKEYVYIATDGKFIYKLGPKKFSGEFAKQHAEEPKIQLSNFEGCPHWYGVMYCPNGDNYELQCKITPEYLDIAHQMKGDWKGYNEGEFTRRFLSKISIMSAFNLFKEVLKNEK